MTTTIYRPDGETGQAPASLAPSPGRSPGCASRCSTTASPTRRCVMTRLAESLAARAGAKVVGGAEEGPARASRRTPRSRATPEIFDRVVAEADIVITGTADCGSCTAYSVYDGIELEKAGRPAVVVTTTEFRPIAETMAEHFGLPELRIARAAAPDRRHRPRHALTLGRRRGRRPCSRSAPAAPRPDPCPRPTHPASSSRSTGASRSSPAAGAGIGRATALLLRASGRRDRGERHRRRPRARTRPTRSLAAAGARWRSPADVTDPEQVEALIAACVDELGEPRHRGQQRRHAPRARAACAVADLDADYVRTIVDQNLIATLLCSRGRGARHGRRGTRRRDRPRQLG